jgi:hypothetical protein
MEPKWQCLHRGNYVDERSCCQHWSKFRRGFHQATDLEAWEIGDLMERQQTNRGVWTMKINSRWATNWTTTQDSQTTTKIHDEVGDRSVRRRREQPGGGGREQEDAYTIIVTSKIHCWCWVTDRFLATMPIPCHLELISLLTLLFSSPCRRSHRCPVHLDNKAAWSRGDVGSGLESMKGRADVVGHIGRRKEWGREADGETNASPSLVSGRRNFTGWRRWLPRKQVCWSVDFTMACQNLWVIYRFSRRCSKLLIVLK